MMKQQYALLSLIFLLLNAVACQPLGKFHSIFFFDK